MEKETLKSRLSGLKVRSKLILLLILVTTFSVLVVSTISYTFGRNIINEQINSDLRVESNRIMDAVNKMVYDRFNDMQILISDSTLVSSEASLDQKNRVLRSALINLGWYDNLYLTDTEGVIVTGSNSTLIGTDVSDEPWYKETENKFIYVSDIYQPPFLDKEILIFANTLADETNKVMGTVFAEFSPEVISDLLKNYSEDFEIFLLTENNKVVASKSSRDITTFEEDSDYIDFHIESEGYLAFDGNNWEMVVQIPKSIAYAPLTTFARLIWATIAVLFVLIIFMGNYSARIFTRPIRRLTEGVSKIEQGQLDQKIVLNTGDEFSYLADNFNKMSSSILEKTNSILEEKGKYKSILESADEGIILFNTENKVIAYNSKYLEICKHKPEELVGGPEKIFRFLNQESEDENTNTVLPIIRQIINNTDFEKEFRAQLTLNMPDLKIINLYTKPVQSENGNLLGRIWVYSDVTAEKIAEKNQNDFIRVASHKLRTPLTAINWNVELLKTKEDIIKNHKDIFGELVTNSERLNALINILLDAADINKGEIAIRKEKINLLDLIQEAYKTVLKRLPAEKKSELKIIDADQVAKLEVEVDPNKVKQVIGFLIENACLYTKEDQKNEVTLKVGVGEGNKATVMVSDNGIGIPEKEQNEIFKKFFRAQNAQLVYTEGTGLSLFMAKIIMESSDEKIWFESAENEGCKFYFTASLA